VSPRKIKRLLHVPRKTSQDLRRSLETLSPNEIDAVLTELNKQAIPFDFIAFPDFIDRGRDAHELSLALRAGRPTPRQLRTILKAAEPLFSLLRAEKLFFGSLAADIEARLADYQRQALIEQTSPLPRHRPGDPWLRGWILLAAEHMRKRNVPLKRIISRIEAIFDIIGHGDLVTREKIRHTIRAARKNNPTFAALFTPQEGKTPRSRPK
jgi:hypothetical protein